MNVCLLNGAKHKQPEYFLHIVELRFYIVELRCIFQKLCFLVLNEGWEVRFVENILQYGNRTGKVY